jgi:hypothetical protein
MKIEDKGILLKDILEKEDKIDVKYDITKRFWQKKEGTLAFKKIKIKL